MNAMASMWPRSDERGINPLAHFLVALRTDASMWPRSDERGIQPVVTS